MANRSVETAERTVESWRTLEQKDVLPEDLRAAIDKQILAGAVTIRDKLIS